MSVTPEDVGDDVGREAVDARDGAGERVITDWSMSNRTSGRLRSGQLKTAAI